jgi:predicted metal-dependent peptidase
MDIKKRFDNAIDQLYKVNQYLAAEVTKLGYPKVIKNSIPDTAGVLWDDKKEKVCFVFDEDFAKTLNEKEFSFVVAHEAMHLINMHIFLFKEKVEEMKRRGKKNLEIDEYIQKLNIASDAVVNDSLTILYELEKSENIGHFKYKVLEEISLQDFSTKAKVDINLFKKVNPSFTDSTVLPAKSDINFPGTVIYGKNIINIDTHDMTAEEVLCLLPEGMGSCSHVWESFLNEDGTLKKEFVDKIKGFIDNNVSNSAISDEESAQVDKMKKFMEDSSDSYTSKAGNDIGLNVRPIDNMDNNSLNWSRLLFQLTDSKDMSDLWNRPNRKMAEVYPDVILPTWKEMEKEEIVIFIDVSGSIDYRACSLFVSVVRNTPKRFKVKAFTFDTVCHEYDIRSGDPPGGGGTSFSIIEKCIQENFKKYPKAIFVLTDGDGDVVTPEYPSRWCWLLYGSCSENCIGNMKRFKIMDLLK